MGICERDIDMFLPINTTQQPGCLKIQQFSRFLIPHQGVVVMRHCCTSATRFIPRARVADLSALISSLSARWLSAGAGQSTLVSGGAK